MKVISAAVFSVACFFGICFLWACGARKETIASRNMQNLTAHYNILYNANELLKESELAIQNSYPDDYASVLPVYKEPTEAAAQSELKILDSIINKANTIISDKAQSLYVKDAYFLKGKINYLKTNFFNAAEFFGYTYTNYADEKALRQQSLVWKARSLLQLNNLDEAADALDTAIKYVQTDKSSVADVYATEAQFNIKTGNEPNAIAMIGKALKQGSTRRNEIRWTYILAQLQERNGLLADAYANYTAVVKSNAPFEMAFNANINRIGIEEEQKGKENNRVERLKALLKEDKNKDFADQIHYMLGNLYLTSSQKEPALKEYTASLRSSTKNQNQKGLTYLRLADLYFKDADYVKSKLYYDSTLANLSPLYPGYELVRVKSSNLDLLANRFNIIAQQDTLQSLGRLTEEIRDKRIEELVRDQIKKESGQSATGLSVTGSGNAASEGKFYFDNSAALSQGLTDFKKRWNNRRLEDNWRRSNKSASEITAAISNDAGATAATSLSQSATNIDALIRTYRESVPLTGAQLQASNEKIITAYYDIAGFYKDELKDTAEAAKIYQKLLDRYPANTHVPAIYYNLYRIYSTTNIAKSAAFKDILLRRFPESLYAKVVLDPAYGQRADENLLALKTVYNEVYNLYTQKEYATVIERVKKVNQQYNSNPLAAQFAYLNSLAAGRTNKLDVFEQSLTQLAASYPDDKLVTPLVMQHLDYIRNNRELMAKRVVALVDFDPNEPRFVLEPKNEPVQQPAQIASSIAKPAGDVNQTGNIASSSAPNPVIASPAEPAKPTGGAPLPVPGILFNLPDSAEYYFVVNVTDPVANLSSSRFGIGQFNRANLGGKQIRHQLKEVNNENQLIFVGSFPSLSAIKEYERNIVPLMKDIMKVPAGKYNTFVITKNGLDKLSDRTSINSYIDFYRQH